MESNHFNYFRLQNFKRFKDLEVNDIGQFNLILGDNNVGKTSLLEALLFEPSFNNFEKKLSNLLHRKYNGSVPNLCTLRLFFNTQALLEYPKIMKFEYSFKIAPKVKNKISYDFDFDNRKVEIIFWSKDGSGVPKEQDLSQGAHSGIELPLIPFSFGYNHKIASDFSKFLGNDLKKRRGVIEALSEIHKGISNLEPDAYRLSHGSSSLNVWLEGRDDTIPFEFLGDGAIKLFAILLKIIASESDEIMIDEIDAGIHYSRQKNFWKGILKFSSDYGTQIFATTHNQECIKAYYEALDELGSEFQDKARTIRLVEHEQTKDILAFTNSFEKMAEELVIGNELR